MGTISASFNAPIPKVGTKGPNKNPISVAFSVERNSGMDCADLADLADLAATQRNRIF
jgi:hypothetical protein